MNFIARFTGAAVGAFAASMLKPVIKHWRLHARLRMLTAKYTNGTFRCARCGKDFHGADFKIPEVKSDLP